MRHLDLFSGIGGFALAARWAGIETVAFCETDPFCRKVLHKHWPGVLKYMDIRDLANPDHVDLLTAGFPCQPFSVAGKKQGSKDDRYLWPEVKRIINKSRPHWIILENVPGIIPHLDPILEDLETEGYDWRAYLVPASAIGAPHKRERIWIIAHSNSQRLNIRSDNRQERYLQDDWQQYIEAIQSEWSQFIPQSWKTFNAQDWLAYSNSFASEQTNQRTKSIKNECNSRMGYTGQNRTNTFEFNWQKDQPPVPGVDDGIPNGLDRNKSLGNAIVPQVVYPIMKIINTIHSVET